METRIRALIKEALLEKNKNKQITYKNILECAQKTAKKTNTAVTDEMVINAIKNEIKQLNDVIGYYKAGSEKHAETTEKIAYCEAVLPKMATEDEIRNFLTNSKLERTIGICMKALNAEFGANMDGKIAANIVKDYINK